MSCLSTSKTKCQGWILSRSKLILIGFIFLISAACAVGWFRFRHFFSPVGTDPSRKIVFEVPLGASFSSIISRLAVANVLTDSLGFKLFLKTQKKTTGLKAGEYELYFHMPPSEVLRILTSGKSIEYLITIPEGVNIFDIALLFEKAHLGTHQEVLRLLRDAQFAQKLLGERVNSLEGYLFPESYAFTKYTTKEALIAQMVELFKKNYLELIAGSAANMTRHQIVTLASIIEKETGAAHERPRIASVFHNRLVKKMRLETDPTILYSLALDRGEMPLNIRRDDVRRPHPYNTYTVYGLPPGPIANPGRDALYAALHPESTPYLFFVSRNDGTHIFSELYGDHEKAVQSFQKNAKAREGKSWRDLNKNQ
jgi:UPF0755 protein